MKYNSFIEDPYVYKDTPDVLVNKFGIKNIKELEAIEQFYVLAKVQNIEKYPTGEFDFKHFKSLHKYLFEDIYEWAGEVRSVGIIKGTTKFCSPEFIESSYINLYKNIKDVKLKKSDPIKNIAFLHGELNMIHPFRDGNGRVTKAFLSAMVYKTHKIQLSYSQVSKKDMIEASISAAVLDYKPMEKIYETIFKHNC